LKAEHDQTEIAMILKRDKSMVNREIRRNTELRGYRPRQAQLLTEQRRQTKAVPRISDTAWSHVDALLKEDWSPEQISLWLKAEHDILISHEWIYQFILQDKADGGDLHSHQRCQKKRRKRYGSYNCRGQLIDRIRIDERPEIVDQRSRIGDWELDTIIGKNHK
jgi:transposase, IS30 family